MDFEQPGLALRYDTIYHEWYQACEVHWCLRGNFGVIFLLSGGGKSHCILWPRAKGTANPSKQTVRIWVLTHLVQQELVLDVDSHRLPDSYSL